MSKLRGDLLAAPLETRCSGCKQKGVATLSVCRIWGAGHCAHDGMVPMRVCEVATLLRPRVASARCMLATASWHDGEAKAVSDTVDTENIWHRLESITPGSHQECPNFWATTIVQSLGCAGVEAAEEAGTRSADGSPPGTLALGQGWHEVVWHERGNRWGGARVWHGVHVKQDPHVAQTINGNGGMMCQPCAAAWPNTWEA